MAICACQVLPSVAAAETAPLHRTQSDSGFQEAFSELAIFLLNGRGFIPYVPAHFSSANRKIVIKT